MNSTNKSISKRALKMSNLLLVYSKCKECGACCFSCGFLDKDSGCVDDSFRLSSRCASFPVIYGNPKEMGYKTYFSVFRTENREEQKNWFIVDFEDCIILQDELLLNSLRWMIHDINSGNKLASFMVSFGDNHLSVFIT